MIGFVDRNDEENTYQILNLVKSMGKIRVPMTIDSDNFNYSRVQ